MTLTKADIISRVYAQGQLTKSEAAQAVEMTLELIKDALSSNQEVLISGFGKWSARAKSERRGRNPQTGDPLMLPARKVVTFRPSRVLKSRIQDKAPSQPAATAEPDAATESPETDDKKPAPSGRVFLASAVCAARRSDSGWRAVFWLIAPFCSLYEAKCCQGQHLALRACISISPKQIGH
jgi:integration host factor subunit alpha